jgi:hypothetical protein
MNCGGRHCVGVCRHCVGVCARLGGIAVSRGAILFLRLCDTTAKARDRCNASENTIKGCIASKIVFFSEICRKHFCSLQKRFLPRLTNKISAKNSFEQIFDSFHEVLWKFIFPKHSSKVLCRNLWANSWFLNFFSSCSLFFDQKTIFPKFPRKENHSYRWVIGLACVYALERACANFSTTAKQNHGCEREEKCNQRLTMGENPTHTPKNQPESIFFFPTSQVLMCWCVDDWCVVCWWHILC